MIKAVIFDLDDTLYEEYDFVLSGFREIGREISLKINMSEYQIYKELVELFRESKEFVIDRFLRKIGLLNNEYKDYLIEVYRTHKPKLILPEDSKFILKYLKENNYKTGLITDGRVITQWNKIESLQIKNFFDHIIITDQYGLEFRKPHKKPFIDMVNYFKIVPSEAIYVGDNIKKDFKAPNELGMRTIRIIRERGLYKEASEADETFLPQFTIKSLYELLRYIGTEVQ